MKYGIITHYDVHNHGAILQLNALVNVLHKAFGISATALQFDKNYDFMGRELKAKYEISAKSFGIYVDYLRQNGIRKMLFNYKKRRVLENFKRENSLVGSYYTACEELDGVIVGSDEVFALHTGPTPVFFGHACPSDKVFAYAGCFGPTTLADIERLHCRDFVSSGLSAMCGLGMRDRNSLEIAHSLTGHETVPVCDPVILYGYTEEIAEMKSPDLPPYLVVYAYDTKMNEPREVDYIRKFARKHSLKIVSPGFYHEWADLNLNANPVELLRYFKYAECIVTDTFHGAVMSIITGRNLAVKLRDNANKLQNLLEEYSLESRILSDDWDLEGMFSHSIDYEKMGKEIENRRKDSMDYLRRMIELPSSSRHEY